MKGDSEANREPVRDVIRPAPPPDIDVIVRRRFVQLNAFHVDTLDLFGYGIDNSNSGGVR